MTDQVYQGTLLALAISALGTGITSVEAHDFLAGVILVVVGVGIIFWRESRKV